MNALRLQDTLMTRADYLVWEEGQTERHEFFHGEVFAMSGGTLDHNTVSLNAAFVLKQHLIGSPCKVFATNVRVQVETADAYFYPDVVVSCQPQDLRDGRALAIEAPVLILEVFSDSTASWDRGGKFAAYRQLASLQEYGLLDPVAGRLDLFRRNAAGRFELFSWSLTDVPETVCEFASVGLICPIQALFEGVEVFLN